MNLSLAGTVLIVTGSTQGVGRAVALEAARNGAEAILICGRDKARGAAVAAEVEALGAKAHFVAADFADAGASDVVADAALEKFGRIDALVNAAGAHRPGIDDVGHPCPVGQALRGQREDALLPDAAGDRRHARAQEAGRHRQHPVDQRAWRRDRPDGLFRQQGGAGADHQERRACTPLRPHPHQRHQHGLGRHAGRTRDACRDARQGAGLAARSRRRSSLSAGCWRRRMSRG